MNLKKARGALICLKKRIAHDVSSIVPRLMQLQFGLTSVDLRDIVSEGVEVSPPILDGIFLPPHYGARDHDDYVPLIKIVSSITPRIIVEIGTGFGNMAANICRQCPNVRIYSVNSPVQEQTGKIVTIGLTHEEIGRVYRDHGFADRVVQIFKNSLDLELAEFFDSPIVDLAIIDGCHDTEYVLNDFYKVQPYIRPGGVVLFHDTHPSMKGHLLTSYKACLTLRQRGYEIFHIRKTWWAIWSKSYRP